MTNALIRWANFPFDRKIFSVRHFREDCSTDLDRQDCLFILGENDAIGKADDYYLMTERTRGKRKFSGWGMSVDELPCLDDGDIIRYDGKEKTLEIIFQIQSGTNTLYVTNACNSRCLFCPQPSTLDNGTLYNDCIELIKLVADAGAIVNVSGGEPTLSRERFIRLLSFSADKWPSTKLFVLTNGRLLKDCSYVEEIFVVRNQETIGFGIPLYSDSSVGHDAIVGVNGAFGQTIQGLFNLALKHAEIEIRFVISKMNYKRLPKLVEFIGRNIPFVTRIAVMGLEPMGYCRENWDRFWIDPENYVETLVEAASEAMNYNITMFLYNMQLCCLPKELHGIAFASISEWKRVYVHECNACPMRCECGGFFASQNDIRFLPKKFKPETKQQ